MGSDRQYEIRVPTAENADGIAAVHTQGWREAYSRLLPERFYDEVVLEERRERWRRFFGRERSLTHYRVAVDGDEVVGFAFGGPAQSDNPVRNLELYAIYTIEAYYGSGVGQDLLNAAIGDAPAQLWVFEDNPRARAFYARNGFLPDGVEKRQPSHENLKELRLVR